MTNGSTDRVLLDFISLVDADDYFKVVVEVRAGGVSYVGRLISEVAYRQSITDLVCKGNAAPTAEVYRQYVRAAEEKRAENERRLAGRPHTPVPEMPEALHMQVGEGESVKIWRLSLEAVEAWTLLEVSVDVA
ncbi:hypothetical protein N4P33_15700 [Streptomyces sp. 15-116A]|uniref:hypothetical protein n=1 Tax=Streptomyces sp. 15-116A TaxID=2259035 RepID=UPI0021B24315|nr:hypothetical protein [Streptomyces sp. 15-116A]MCT7353606.1 hypothetical protein [Streptomyces sp. 15-116A]